MVTLARRELPFSSKSFHLWDTHPRVQKTVPTFCRVLGPVHKCMVHFCPSSLPLAHYYRPRLSLAFGCCCTRKKSSCRRRRSFLSDAVARGVSGRCAMPYEPHHTTIFLAGYDRNPECLCHPNKCQLRSSRCSKSVWNTPESAVCSWTKDAFISRWWRPDNSSWF